MNSVNIYQKFDKIDDRNVESESFFLREALSTKQRVSEDSRLLMVKTAIEKGADVNSQSLNKNSPVHMAIQYGFLKIVKYLMEKTFVRLDIKNDDGKTVVGLLKKKCKKRT